MKVNKTNCKCCKHKNNPAGAEQRSNTAQSLPVAWSTLEDYQRGLDSMAELCGKIAAMKAFGFSNEKALEAIFAWSAFNDMEDCDENTVTEDIGAINIV